MIDIAGSIRKRMPIIAIYVIALLFFIFKMLFYNVYVARFPDEIEHISYVAYLQSTGKIIPNFSDMRTLVYENKDSNLISSAGLTEKMKFGNDFNYICHPPLYYQVLRLSGGVTADKGTGVIRVNVFRLRYFSMLIALAAMILIFYIGASRIGSNLVFHFMYAVICVSVPMLAYECAGVNNDTMSLLCFSLFSLAVIRFLEKKRNVGTYFLLAFGLCGCFLSKLTAGVIAIFALINLIVFLAVKERKLTFLFSWKLLITLPVYIMLACYFLVVKFTTGSIQPSFANLCPQQFFKSGFYTPQLKNSMNFHQYVYYFYKCFRSTWTSIASHISLPKGYHFYSPNESGLIAITLLPVFVYVRPLFKKSKELVGGFVGCAYLAIVTTVGIQFVHAYKEYKYFSGYLGGFQSRYYLCVIIVLAFAAVILAKAIYYSDSEKLHEGQKTGKVPLNKKKLVVNVACILFSCLLIYEDFIYFILNFKSYIFVNK